MLNSGILNPGLLDKLRHTNMIAILASDPYAAEKTVTRTVPFADAATALPNGSEHPNTVTRIHVEMN